MTADYCLIPLVTTLPEDSISELPLNNGLAPDDHQKSTSQREKLLYLEGLRGMAALW